MARSSINKNSTHISRNLAIISSFANKHITHVEWKRAFSVDFTVIKHIPMSGGYFQTLKPKKHKSCTSYTQKTKPYCFPVCCMLILEMCYMLEQCFVVWVLMELLSSHSFFRRKETTLPWCKLGNLHWKWWIDCSCDEEIRNQFCAKRFHAYIFASLWKHRIKTLRLFKFILLCPCANAVQASACHHMVSEC